MVRPCEHTLQLRDILADGFEAPPEYYENHWYGGSLKKYPTEIKGTFVDDTFHTLTEEGC